MHSLVVPGGTGTGCSSTGRAEMKDNAQFLSFGESANFHLLLVRRFAKIRAPEALLQGAAALCRALSSASAAAPLQQRLCSSASRGQQRLSPRLRLSPLLRLSPCFRQLFIASHCGARARLIGGTCEAEWGTCEGARAGLSHPTATWVFSLSPSPRPSLPPSFPASCRRGVFLFVFARFSKGGVL
jgi:hypothetical protein